MNPRTIVVVGAGQAGGWVAKTLRAANFSGCIVLIGEEMHPPHERPPLSKAVLAGEAEAASTYLFKGDEFVKLELDFRPGTRAVTIDRAAKRVVLAGDEAIAYDKLFLCTGGAARRLAVPGGDGPRVHYLRTIADSLAIGSRLSEIRHLVVIGGGWIGLEVAAAARMRKLSVTLIEGLSRLCERSVPPEVSAHLLALHRRNGVEIVLEEGVKAIDDGERVAVELASGRRVQGGAVVAGIGLAPNVALAQAAGIAVDNGIVVDDQGRTSDPDIFAAGDVANAPLACLGRRVRLESWANAQNQAIVAAQAALGGDARYDELPWFWSDQYDMNLQILGLPARWPAPVVRGEPAGGSFSLFFLDDGRIASVVSVNAPRDLRAVKKLIQTRKPVRAEDLADPRIQLQRL
ncbi:MAG: FAD-dependent oxidoreductase [Betaproteobacteria bacterium]|nr:FAD-dependent oxidoreductase [Betaproteobacteria bacterium]